jgi:hypothetical protein
MIKFEPLQFSGRIYIMSQSRIFQSALNLQKLYDRFNCEKVEFDY